MSVSPLSGAMAQPTAPQKKKKKRGGALLLVSGVALAASLSGVFAANTIAINSGNGVEFGAGTAATTACEESLSTAITQSYSATLNSNAGGFQVGNIVITGDFNDCKGDTISVTLVGASGAVMCSIDGATSKPEITSFTSNAASVASGSDGFKIASAASGLTDGTDAAVTIPVAAGCDSTTVLKIALATS